MPQIDNLTVDLRRLYGQTATEKDKTLRAILSEVDEQPGVGNGNFAIDTPAELAAVRQRLAPTPDLFERFVEVTARPTDPVGPKITTDDQAAAEVRNFLRSPRGNEFVGMKKKTGQVEDCGDYFAVRVPGAMSLGWWEAHVDKKLGKVTTLHDMNFWNEPLRTWQNIDKQY